MKQEYPDKAMINMVEVDITDQQFAEYLKFQDENWTWNTEPGYNKFIANGKLIAIVRYKNSFPCARKIWIDVDTFVGYIHDAIKVIKKNYPISCICQKED